MFRFNGVRRREGLRMSEEPPVTPTPRHPDTLAKDYGSYSFWLESSGDDLTPRPALDGSAEVDVVILGAGFTGLWTAYCLLRRDPSLSVLVVEREIAGFGASGRNGGWCVADFPVSPSVM